MEIAKSERRILIEKGYEENKKMINKIERDVYRESIRANFTPKGLIRNAWRYSLYTLKLAVTLVIIHYVVGLF